MTPNRLIRRGALVLAAVGVSAGFAACGDSDDTSTAAATTAKSGTGAAKAGKLVFADAAVASSLDVDGPAATAPANLMVLNNAYEGLVNYKFKPNDSALGGGNMLDTSSMAPGLAESWDQTDTGVTFKLRKGVKSQYGNELTTKDIKYTFERNMALKGTGSFILGTNGKVKSVKIDGDYEFTYVTEGPAPVQLAALASAYVKIVDSTEAKKHATAKDKWSSTWLGANTAGFGPYNVKSYTSGKSIVLEPSATYWGTKAQNEIEILPIPDAGNRLAAVEKGDVNLTTNLTPTQNKQASEKSDLATFRFNGNVVLNLYPNQKQIEKFVDPKVRQALYYAIPTDQIIKQVYLGYAFDPKSLVSPYYTGYDNSSWPYKYDVAKAKSLLAEAGAEGLSFKMYYSSGSATLAQVAPILQSSFEAVGLKVELVARPESEILTRHFGKRDLDSTLFDLAALVPPEIGNLGDVWTTDSFGNTTGYSNKAFDAQAKIVGSTLNGPERDTAIKELQKIGSNDAPTVSMAGIQTVAVTSGNVSGYSWTPEGSIPFAPLTVADGQ